jgi:hypothetical protein
MRINIIGRGEGWEEGYEAPGVHWAINYFHPKADILFEIHPESHPYHDKLAHERANARLIGIPVITQADYPLDVVMQEFGTDYLGSSTDYLIACAILYGKDEIHLYGVSMDDRGDHYEKRCATDFWCGVAIGRGIKVTVHGNSTVMTTADGLQYGTFKPMARQYKKEVIPRGN